MDESSSLSVNQEVSGAVVAGPTGRRRRAGRTNFHLFKIFFHSYISFFPKSPNLALDFRKSVTNGVDRDFKFRIFFEKKEKNNEIEGDNNLRFGSASKALTTENIKKNFLDPVCATDLRV